MLLRLSVGETDLESLLPDRWAASHPEHVLKHRLEESRRKAARQQEKRQQRRSSSSPRVEGQEADRPGKIPSRGSRSLPLTAGAHGRRRGW